MTKFFDKIKDFFFNVIFGIYWGFICGLMVAMTLFTIHHLPFWCIGVSLFFMLFHLSDFKKFFEEKNWLAITGRYIAIFSISAFIVSIFGFALNGFGQMDIFDMFIPLVIPICILLGAIWALLERYGSHTIFYRECAKVIDGLHVLGVFWRY